MVSKTIEEAKWSETKALLNEPTVTLGKYFSYILRRTPRRLLHQLSYAKFAAKLIGPGKRVLDVGCSEGIGTLLLAEFAEQCVGVDIDLEAVQSAQQNFERPNLRFLHGDALEMSVGRFDAVVNFDVIEHIYRENEDRFLRGLTKHLEKPGMLIIGTPNETSDIYASAVTKAGHVNLYSADRLRETLSRSFQTVFVFSANDEVVHTGFSPMAHYLIGVGVGLK